jgi:hypothetical protein
MSGSSFEVVVVSVDRWLAVQAYASSLGLILAHCTSEVPMSILRFLKCDNAQTTILFAASLAVIVGAVGLSVDVGSLCYAENKLHTAAEAVALSAALEVAPCFGATPCAAMQAAAKSALAENGYNNSTLTSNCTAGPVNSLSLMINNPPCLRGASVDPNTGKAKYVEALLSMPSPTYFTRLIGFNNVPLSARAEAVRTSNPNCIYALDPSGPNAITVDILSTLTANCGIVDESSSSAAFTCGILASVHATNLKITGGAQGLLCSASPPPRTNVPVPTPADPLSTLPKPTVLSCGSSVLPPYHGSAGPLIILGTAVLYPDAAYCGGITVGPLANVTFMPGTYVIRSVGLFGGVSFSLLSTVTGNGVTFYNYGPQGGVTFTASSVTVGTFTLTAPTTGTYAGVLFFQDPGNTAPALVLASSSLNTTVEGAFYFPTATLTTAVSGSAKYNIIVAKDIAFVALSFPFGSLNTTSLNNNYSSLANGSPLVGGGSALVQ